MNYKKMFALLLNKVPSVAVAEVGYKFQTIVSTFIRIILDDWPEPVEF